MAEKANVFATLGASNHSGGTREENDYYATEPLATKLLLEVEKFNKDIWECACGGMHMTNILKEFNYNVYSTDIIKRHEDCDEIVDFLNTDKKWHGDIITNPPYKHAEKFVRKALDLVDDGNRVAVFCKTLFVEGKSRGQLYRTQPPKYIYNFSGRVNCAKDGRFDLYTSSAVAYSWFIWEKGYQGDTITRWIN